MGQGYSLNSLPAGPSAIEGTELSDLTFEKPLGGARFLRTIRARHQNGVVVVKVCTKPNSTVSFRNYAAALKAERHALKDVPNVLPYQKIRETTAVGLLVRQFIHNSLYDRVSVRPFLETIEKKWIAYQLICAVRDCHERQVYHGDIKSENVLVTSWGWVYLTDFASAFKPVYLPEDNPADFSFYYDISARRTCYLAPERFLAAGYEPRESNRVHWSMDIFSLGCVIAELFTESPTFTLSQLFRYRKGDYDPTVSLLNKTDDEHIRALITNMICLNPEDRWHPQDYLDEYKGKVFPLYFYQHLDALMQEITDPTSGRKAIVANENNSGGSDDRIDRLYDDFEMLSVSLGYEDSEILRPSPCSGPDEGLFPLQVDLPNHRHTANASLAKTGDNGTFILLNVITSSLRSAARAASKIRACELLLAFAERVPDEAKLDRILPYVMPLMDDGNDMVLVAALRTMTQLLALVTVASPVNSSLFTQYIFPRLQNFVSTGGFKQNPIVRATYAACLATLAETASRFLDMMQALREDGSLPAGDKALEGDVDGPLAYYDAYDTTRSEVLDQFEGQTKVFLTDNNNAVRRAFLSSVPSLCIFFGEARSSDLILSHLNTYLNDSDWQLKCAFLKTIVGVAVYVGGATLEEFVLPLIVQALTDPQESVIEQALRSLANIAEVGLLQRSKTWELIDLVARFEVHPNMWIKEAASHFVAAATTYLSLADIRILVAPLIKPYLKVPVSNLTESELLDALKKPLPRAVLDLALQWAGRVDRSVFWKHAKEARQLSYRTAQQIPPVSSVAELGPKSLARIPKTDEDEQWLGRLRNAGMRDEDEIKILAFREYLWRTAQRIKRDDPSTGETMYDQLISLAKLKITPQTVIFDTDLDLYEQKQQEQGLQDFQEALREAARPPMDTSEVNGAATDANEFGMKLQVDIKPQALRLPGLRRQTSGSGQSLSSSPSSGIGLLGKHGDHPGHPNNSIGLITGAERRNKSLPEVGTDDAVAAGRLNTPTADSRKISNANHSDNPKRKPSRKELARTGHNYEGNDPTVLKLLDTLYVDNFPIDAASFGPLILPLRRGPIPSSTSNQASAAAWRPQGQLVAVLSEHTDRVTRILVSPDHLFFLTASDDGTIRVWDSSRLERNVAHKSRHFHSMAPGTRITSVCFIESTHTFVCTGSDGFVHIVKVDVVDVENGPKYTGSKELDAKVRWQIPNTTPNNEFAVWSEHYRGESGSTLVLLTNIGRILAIDMRYMSIIFELHNPAQHGSPTCFCIGKRHDWILVGTSHGVLDLWDLRFQLRLRSWNLPNAAPISRLQLHPSKKTARRNRVCISGGTSRGEVTVWDIEKLICHEVYRPSHAYSKERLNAREYELRNMEDDRSEGLLDRVGGPVTPEVVTPEAALAAPALTISAHFGMNQTSEDPNTQHAFAVTGGPDGKVRFWDCERLEGCRLVSGGASDEKPVYTFSSLGLDTRVLSEKAPESSQQVGNTVESNKVASTTNTPKRSTGRNSTTIKPSRYEAIRLSAQHLLDEHLDIITDVAMLERPFGMVLSADRSGQVFVHQ